ncbi:hypothetical protein [Neisseria chenwenguii]|uniref:hypothetical protein n=1 Tax=Neisseria chenwenguii TaxID=1853278 RepID=UPI000F4EFEAE|nr:hypothetical protein [Neisseria chenwenguii]ROV57291.1 hypothetical protein EGS38_00985 [Neisseria chenwenguii]
MNKPKMALLSTLIAFSLTACEEGTGMNITFKSKNQEKSASSAISLDIDGQDVKLGTSSSETIKTDGGRKITVETNDSVKLSPEEANGESVRGIPEIADWTPIFKSWENGCTDSPQLERLFNSLETNTTVPPSGYEGYVDKVPLHYRGNNDPNVNVKRFYAKITGNYYNLPVYGITRYYGKDHDEAGKALDLDVSYEEAAKILAKINYQPMEDQTLIREDYGQAFLTDFDGRARLICDFSI